jgi:hypothetical protein
VAELDKLDPKIAKLAQEDFNKLLNKTNLCKSLADKGIVPQPHLSLKNLIELQRIRNWRMTIPN